MITCLRRNALCALAVVLAGCQTIGADSVQRDRLDYATAIGDSWKEQVLLNIARGFQALISSDESVKLSRLIIALGNQDPGFGEYFWEAGPKRVLAGMEALLASVAQRGLLAIDNPLRAAEHFFCLVKGAPDYRLLLGCAPALTVEEAEVHVREVVGLFMRGYRV